MFGILQSCLSQHNIKEDSVQTSLEFNSSLHPYKILDETFPSSLASLRSLVKHRWLDSQTACGHEGELQKHKNRAKNVKENIRSCEVPLYFVLFFLLLLVLSLAPRGISPGTPVFPSPQKPTFPNSNSTRNHVDEEPLCGCATCKSLFIYLFILFIWIQTYRIFYFSRRLFAKHLTLSSWCRFLSSRSRSRKIRILSISKFFLFIVVIVISILLKTAFWQTSIHSQQSLVKML